MVKRYLSKKARDALLTVLRISVSAGLFAVLIVLNLKNLANIPSILESLNIWLALAGIFFYFLGIALEAPRWQSLLAANKISIPQSYLLGTVLIGFFYSTLLPTTVGGDAYRGIDMHRTFRVPLHENILAIYLGRFLGIVSGIMFLIISFAFGMYKHLSRPLALGFIIAVPVIIFLIAITVIPKKFRIDSMFRKIKFLKRFAGSILGFSDVLDSYKRKGKTVAICFVYSILGNICTFISFFFISLALNIKIGFLSYMFIVPTTWTVSNIPITLGGMGVRESTLVLLLKEFGVSASSALTFSLIVLLANILIAIAGGIIYIARNALARHKDKP
jgi:uncharacterized protein (TIRG00374 family)